MESRVSGARIPADLPQGFILNDAGMYSFVCQDVFKDILSFITAIPDHLKPLFLIPIRIEAPANHLAADGIVHIANRLAKRDVEEFHPVANSEESDWFGTETFVYDDATPTVAPSTPGSIFDIDGADEKTHHQDLPENQDQNLQPDADTSYMSDVDPTESYLRYPYRTEESPLRHSSEITVVVPITVHVALTPEELEKRTPDSIADNAKPCDVSLVSYDKRSRIFSFGVGCGKGQYTVKAKLNDLRHVALNCSCPYWRWNGPEYHASQNNYLLGNPAGDASTPDVRDPDRQFHLCKHAYSVVARLDEFVDEISEENWGLDDEELMEEIDEEWDRMEGTAEIPLEETQSDNLEAEVVEPETEEGTDAEADADADVDVDAELEPFDDSEEDTTEIIPEAEAESADDEESLELTDDDLESFSEDSEPTSEYPVIDAEPDLDASEAAKKIIEEEEEDKEK